MQVLRWISEDGRVKSLAIFYLLFLLSLYYFLCPAIITASARLGGEQSRAASCRRSRVFEIMPRKQLQQRFNDARALFLLTRRTAPEIDHTKPLGIKLLPTAVRG